MPIRFVAATLVLAVASKSDTSEFIDHTLADAIFAIAPPKTPTAFVPAPYAATMPLTPSTSVLDTVLGIITAPDSAMSDANALLICWRMATGFTDTPNLLLVSYSDPVEKFPGPALLISPK